MGFELVDSLLGAGAYFKQLGGAFVFSLDLVEVDAKLVDIGAVERHKLLAGAHAVAYLHADSLDAVRSGGRYVVYVFGIDIGGVFFHLRHVELPGHVDGDFGQLLLVGGRIFVALAARGCKQEHSDRKYVLSHIGFRLFF